MIDAMMFNSDEFKQQVLGSVGGEPTDPYEDLITEAPVIPRGVRTIIQDASILGKNDKLVKAEELNSALNGIMTKYNQEYGLDLNIDFTNLSKTLVAVSDPKSSRVLQLYLSKVYGSMKSILVMHMISRLGLIVDYLLQPERLFAANGSELSTADLFLVCDQLLGYIDKLECLKGDIQIKGDDLELKKLGEEAAREDELSTDAVDQFMKLLNKENGNQN